METKIINRTNLTSEIEYYIKINKNNSSINNSLNKYGDSEKCKSCLNALNNIKSSQLNVKNFIDLINKKLNMSVYQTKG